AVLAHQTDAARGVHAPTQCVHAARCGEALGEIKAPTLVIHGDHDPLVPYPNGKYLAEHIPGARLSTYENVGHLPPTEATERFNREVMEFLGCD
ncbi:MAG: alpha/beta hydrolase, partial [Chloroflexi bacterium]|nr:alpha/beta hydrolase [Chloroflexota bacterium]